MNKILIATTNKGKFAEMIHLLGDLPFVFLSLLDLKEQIDEPEETGTTLEDNAILKTKYYANKTGLITISDDTGLFVDALDNWPGVKAARVGKTDEERREILLEKMKDIPEEKRQAKFKTCIACYNPNNQNTFFSFGEVEGKILKKKVEQGNNNFGYNPLFSVPKLNKAFAEMTLVEKNSISHRGKAIKKIAYYLNNQFGNKNIVVPVGVVVKEGKILLAKRYDPHNPEFHGKWELPGGLMEFDETMEENVVRELLEETNFKTEVVKKIDYIHLDQRKTQDFQYQVFLIPYLCKVIEKQGEFNDAEIIEIIWIDPDDYVNYDYIADNKNMMGKIIPEIKNIIKENNL